MNQRLSIIALSTLLGACSAAYTTDEPGDEPAPATAGAEGPVAEGSALASRVRLDGPLSCQEGSGLPGADALGACAGGEETEPNDTSAVAASTRDHLCGAVRGADVDVIKVELPAGRWLGYVVEASAPIVVSITGGARAVTATHVEGATCSPTPATVLLTIRARGSATARYAVRLQRR